MTVLFLGPPNHAENILFRLKRKIFRDLGLASALALPPLLPAVLPESPEEGPRPAFPVLPLTSGGWECMNGIVYLRMNPAQFADGSFPSLLPPPGWFPGFYMCADENRTGGKDVMEILGTPPALSLGTVYEKAAELKTCGGETWWRRVELETVRETKLHL